jgi:hypothetical protein
VLPELMPTNTMTTSANSSRVSASLPDSIGLNSIDRWYVVPETDDPEGPFFPMCIVTTVTLKQPPQVTAMVEALRAVERKYPQFRLGYRLDYRRTRYQRIPDGELDSYLASLVQTGPVEQSHDETISLAIRTNNTPMSQPLAILLQGNRVILKMHHSFGDGKFLFLLMSRLLLALADPAAFDRLPYLPPHFGLPMWRVIAQSPRQIARTFGGFLNTLRQYATPATDAPHKALDPIVSGSEMLVIFKTVPAQTLGAWNDLRASLSSDVHVSLNTLLQVLVSHRLIELGLMSPGPTYTVPVDVHRYLRSPDDYYPGNVASQIRLTLPARPAIDLKADCLELQQQANERFERAAPLSAIPMDWLLMLAGDATYKRENRKWLLGAMKTDSRWFVLTNLGSLDSDFEPLAASVDFASGVFLVVPLMGAPPLVLSFNTLGGQGNFAVTYNPRVLSAEQVNSILDSISL